MTRGRVAAVASTSLPLVYAAYAPVIVALGVVNAAITGAVSRVAPPDERGTFFGVVSAIESCTGIVGPMVGGVVSLKIDELVSKRVSPFVFLTHGNCCHFVD